MQQVRHPASRPAARLRAGQLRRGARPTSRAMACAANFAWANRQTIQHLAEKALHRGAGGIGPRDVGLRLHLRRLPQHREARGARGRRAAAPALRAPQGRDARARPARAERRLAARPAGHRPGRHGDARATSASARSARSRRPSGSSCHGAGRVLSPHRRRDEVRRPRPHRRAREGGDHGDGRRGAARSPRRCAAPTRTSRSVVDVMESAGVSVAVARLRPIGVIKG